MTTGTFVHSYLLLNYIMVQRHDQFELLCLLLEVKMRAGISNSIHRNVHYGIGGKQRITLAIEVYTQHSSIAQQDGNLHLCH